MVTKQDYEEKARHSQSMAFNAAIDGDEWRIKFHNDMQLFWLSMAAMSRG